MLEKSEHPNCRYLLDHNNLHAIAHAEYKRNYRQQNK